MTEAQYRHIRGFLSRILGRTDFLLMGGPGMMKLVWPDFEIQIGDRARRPFAARNRFFSLSFGGVARTPECLWRMLPVLREATQSYALRFPWLIDAVKTGRVFLEDSPAMVDYLTSSPSPYRPLFEDFVRLRREYAGDELLDFDALRKVFFHVAGSISQLNCGEEDGLERSPGRHLRVPRGHLWIFIDLLQGRGFLSGELRRWVSGLRCERAVVLDAADWRHIRRHMTRDTVVFCFGERDERQRPECVRFLLGHLDLFRHVAFINLGETFPPENLSAHARRTASFFLGSSVCRFAALMPTLPPLHRIPYIPVVSRHILRHRLPVDPIYDFFVSSNGERDLGFLFRHESFFVRRKFLIGTKWGGACEQEGAAGKRRYWATCRRIRERFPGALLVPTVPLYALLYLWQSARTIVIMYPPAWEKTSYTLAAALLSGRGIVTTEHPGIARIDPTCFRFYDPTAHYDDQSLADLFCGEQGSLRAAHRALRFAQRRLEFHKIIDSIVLSTRTA